MQKEKWKAVGDFIIKNCKIIFPVVLIVVAAVTVAFALNARKAKAELTESSQESSSVQESSMAAAASEEEPGEVPLSENDNEELFTLIATYYNAMAQGDTETILSICSEYSENELLRLSERAKYLEYYPTLEIYTKPGPETGSIIAYVYYKLVFVNHEAEVPGFQAWYICTDEQGKLYINTSEPSDEVNNYIATVSTQADVVELYNRVNVEYNEVVTAHPELLTYMKELNAQVNTSVGTALAQENASQTGQETGGAEAQESVPQENPAQQETQPESTEPEGPKTATATTTVNVRSSDSEQADKLGKVTGGTKVEVQEVRANGWTKIVYEGKDGYIKSEYLLMAESAAGQDSIGTVTATTNINVRSAASETAERLGVLAGGESLELLANENGWCKVKYNGQVGYVKADYVTQ